MTQLRIKFLGDQLGPKFKRNRTRDGEIVLAAARETAKTAQAELLARGRRDISSAGRFGRRWTEGLTAPITEGGGRIVLNLSHAVPYFMVFQRGKVIRGSRCSGYLSHLATLKACALATIQEVYSASIERGRPRCCFSMRDRKRPVYFGKTKVTIPKKFHVLEIGRDVGAQVQGILSQ
jgi:hypothetical protein